jgi:hypothetical protein
MKSTKKTLTLVFIFSQIYFSFSQTNPTVKAIDKTIAEIKNNLRSYEKIEEINNGRGKKLAYRKNSETDLITVKSIEPTIEKNVSWYYYNNDYVFCEVYWINSDSTVLFHEKYYFNDAHLIGWIKTGNEEIEPSTREFKNLDNTGLYAYGMELKAKLPK